MGNTKHASNYATRAIAGLNFPQLPESN